MHPGWQGVFPQKALWEQFGAPTSGSCSEPPSGEISPCSQTRKEKLAGEVGSLGLHSMTIPISFFKTGGSGKSTFKIKTAAAFTLLIIPRETAPDLAGAGGLVCAGISFPDKNNVQIAEITRQGSAAGWEGAQMEGGPGQERLLGRRDRGAPGPACRGRLPGVGGELCAWPSRCWWFSRVWELSCPELHSRGCGGGRQGGPPGRAGREAWPGAAWQQGWWEKLLPPALPCCDRGQLVALLGSVKGGTSVSSALLASVTVFLPRQQCWGAPRLLWCLGKARGECGKLTWPRSHGVASGWVWFHRENHWSLLHGFSKATGIIFALNPDEGRKCECPWGERKLQKSDNLQKQMWACTLCVWKCLPAGEGCPSDPLSGACQPQPGLSSACPAALATASLPQAACLPGLSCPLPASSRAAWPLCAPGGCKYLLRSPAKSGSGQTRKKSCSLSRAGGYFGN